MTVDLSLGMISAIVALAGMAGMLIGVGVAWGMMKRTVAVLAEQYSLLSNVEIPALKLSIRNIEIRCEQNRCDCQDKIYDRVNTIAGFVEFMKGRMVQQGIKFDGE